MLSKLGRCAASLCEKRTSPETSEVVLYQLLKQQAEANAKILEIIAHNTSVSKDKLSNMELRQNWENKSDVQGATRHVQQWATGGSANISPAQLDILASKLLSGEAKLGLFSYGDEMLKKDTRRTHGFFAKIMANESKQGSKEKSKTWDSRIPFDHYNVAVGKAITDTEFPRGKRTAPQI